MPFSCAVALLGVAVPFAGIFLPRLVIDLLAKSAPPRQIILQVGSYTLMLAALYFLSEFFTRNRGWRNNHITYGSARDLLFINLECEYSYLENPERQELFARLKQNIDNPATNCYDKSITALTGIVTGCLGFALYSFVLSGMNLWIVLLLTVTSTVNYFALRHANRFEHNNKENWAPLEKKIAYLLNATGSYEYGKDIRLYNMKPWFMELTHGLFSQRSKWDSSVQNRHFMAKFVNALIVLLRDGVAYALLIYMVTQGRIGITDFILFFGAIAGFSTFISKTIESVGSLGGALLYIKDVKDYLDGGRIVEASDPAANPSTSLPPSIEFRNVHFSYTKERKTLNGLSFSVPAGGKVAIVGVNGAGKTTLVKMLCGFYLPDEGEILISGIDVRRYRKQELLNLYSTVFQDEFILPLTLAENITPNDKDSDGIRDSLQRAGLLEYIDGLPKGLQSRMTKAVREDGIMLSGGQMQKLHLARALYKDAPILILDEPTAALDPIAESKVYENYHELSGGKTSIFISHRLASTRFCDNILLIRDGKVLESGNHDDLMALNGEYAEMYEVQSHYYRESAIDETT
jgi:ABC-type multidrug transport system fused ATPase/permease subunit